MLNVRATPLQRIHLWKTPVVSVLHPCLSWETDWEQAVTTKEAPNCSV